MDIETRDIEIRSLRPNSGEVDGLPRNPRKISKKMLEKLKKSLQDAPEMLRLRELIVVPHGDTFVVIAGNQRLEAAKAVGMDTLPCKVLPEDTPAEKLREYAIKDNLPFGEDDWEVIASDWDTAELEEWGMSVPEEWKEKEEAAEDDFDESEVTEDVCQRGEIWQLGRHRLMCGDSTDEASVALLMDGDKADMVFTDPPYNMGYSGAGIIRETKKNVRNRIKEIIDFDAKSISFLSKMDIGSIYIFTSKDLIPKYFEIFKDWKFNILVWVKSNNPPMCNNNFLPDIEYLLYFHKGKRIWNNGLRPLDIYKRAYYSSRQEGHAEAGDIHPTMKPIRLIAEKLQISSNENSSVLDLFGGSGSTLIAAEQLGRKCYMMELDPHYCDVIIARWEKLTGKKATKIN